MMPAITLRLASSVILGSAALITHQSAAQANLLINGSFEQAPVSPGDSNGNLFANMPAGSGNASWDTWTSIPGWVAGAGDAIEIQTKNTVGVTAQDGNYYVELDSHPGARADSLMFQTITTSASQQTLSFYYRPRTGADGENVITASLNGTDVASVSGPSVTYPGNQWTLVSVIVNLIAGNNKIQFAASGTNPTYGGFIDNVVLTPLPAAAWLFGSAFLGLCWLGRRAGTRGVGMLPTG
jgi:hypothetical protein